MNLINELKKLVKSYGDVILKAIIIFLIAFLSYCIMQWTQIFVPRFPPPLWQTLHIVVDPIVLGLVSAFIFIIWQTKSRSCFWISLTLIIMGLLGFVGVSIINYYSGNPDFTFPIKECGVNNQSGNLICKDPLQVPYFTNQRICDLPTDLNNLLKEDNIIASINQMLIDGSSVRNDFSALKFTGNENVTSINFTFNITTNTSSTCGWGGGDVRFYTKEENNIRAEKLITYLIGLLGFISISVPLMMVNIKKLSE